jgi:hypothetical protein
MIMTGHLDQVAIDPALHDTGIVILEKPFGMAQLYSAILMALGGTAKAP